MSLSSFHGIGELWRETLGDERICIAVIDCPVDLSHPCFQGADLTQFDDRALIGGSTVAHGTMVASIIFGRPGSSVEGVAPGCRGLLIPVFSEKRRKISQLALSTAICKAVEHGAHVINISSGQLTYFGESEDLLAHAIEAAHKKNVLIIAAAGNDRDPRQNRHECLHVPAALPTVLTAGAMDENGHPLECSCWGPAYQAQGILALGKDVLGAMPGGGVRRWTGTSIATPIVTGVAGLLLSWQLKKGRRPDPHAVRAAILAGAQACDPMDVDDCTPYMAGKLDAVGAIKFLSRETKMSEQSESAEVTQGKPIVINASESTPPTAVSPPPSPTNVTASSGSSVPPTAGRSSAAPPSAPLPASAHGISASACECEEGKGLVFFIGLVNYDFGTEARRDTFKQQMPPVWYRHETDEFRFDEGLDDDGRDELRRQGFREYPPNPFDARQMVAYLRLRPEEARELIWTLNLELTPVYCVEPVGGFASSVYKKLVDMLDGQNRAAGEYPRVPGDPEYVERVSVPAVLTGRSVRLFSGQEVTEILVDAPRGMYAWTTNKLLERSRPVIQAAIDAAAALRPAGVPAPNPDDIVRLILNKLYYEYRNLGVTSPDRALNFAATNIFSLTEALVKAMSQGKTLDRIDVVKSPYCRVDSDCWDVQLKFIDPENTNRAYTVLRYSIDVSDKLPVTLGKVVDYISTT